MSACLVVGAGVDGFCECIYCGARWSDDDYAAGASWCMEYELGPARIVHGVAFSDEFEDEVGAGSVLAADYGCECVLCLEAC